MASLDTETGARRKPGDKNPGNEFGNSTGTLFGSGSSVAIESGNTWNPDSAGWDIDLTRRMRVLLHITPLLQLKANDNRRDDELRHYDSLTLAMKALDIIAERMGMEAEADRDTLVRQLRPLLESMDRASGVLHDKGRHERAVDRVLGGLRNDADGRRPFRIDYADVDPSGEVITRRLEFRIVSDAFGQFGGTVLRLTNEAVNLFFNALELDIEDAQAATEAIVQSQLERGRFEEAVRSAQYALRQSRLYKERLGRVLQDTQRDITRVDWQQTVPKLIDDATRHLEARLDTERSIVDSTHQRIDNLQPGGAEARAVARIADLMLRCIDTHTLLQRELMTARTTFLDSQARQSFLPATIRMLPDLTADVLTPLLGMGSVDATLVSEAVIPNLLGPAVAPLPSLCTLIEGLLRPRRKPRRDFVTVEPMDIGQISDELARYSVETRQAALSALAALDGPVKLSDVLASARRADLSTDVLEVIVLLLLQNFDRESVPEHGSVPLFTIERLGADPLEEGVRWTLDDPDFFGDDMIVTPWRGEPVADATTGPTA